jgi:crossover junction endodeoxyribonuclease RuvC
VIVGIDPGIKGAAAVIDNNGHMADVIDIPTLKANDDRREIDTVALFEWLRRQVKPRRIVIENVHSMPHDGHVGAFRFGMAFGMIRAICTRVTPDIELVAPAVWREYFDLLGQDKEASRMLAQRLFPAMFDKLTRQMDHNRAEAMLIAHWAVRPPIGKNWK